MMNKTRKHPSFAISLKSYTEFTAAINTGGLHRSQLKNFDEQFTEIVKQLGNHLFAEQIKSISAHCQDPEVAVASLDIPINDKLSSSENAFAGVAACMAVGLNIFTPVNSRNNMPFTVYNASYDNERRMRDMGIAYYSPDVKLGFHNDASIDRTAVSLPYNLLIYNIFIAYKNPGNFHWVPLTLWEEKDYYADLLGVVRDFKINLTPIAYKQQDSIQLSNAKHIIAPIFKRNSNNELTMFLNGEVVAPLDGASFDSNTIAQMQASISTNSHRYSIPQQMRRAIFLGNTKGLHARDVFENPLDNSSITRSFLRAIDCKGELIKNSINSYE